MKLADSKQRKLKLALLFVVAANVAAGISYNKVSSHQTELASSDDLVGGSGVDTSEPPDDDAPLSQSPNAVSVQPMIREVSRPTVISGQPHAPASGVLHPVHCQVPLRATFTEKITANGYKTLITLHELNAPAGSPRMPDAEFEANGSFRDNGIIGQKNQVFANKLSDLAEQKLSEAGHCDISTSSSVDISPDDSVAPQREVINSRIANCQISSSTRQPLTNDGRLGCNIALLKRLAAQRDVNSIHSKLQVERNLENLVKGELSIPLRNRLMSNDPAVNASGEKIVDQLVSLIQTIGDNYEIDEARTNRIIGQLQGLRYGAQVYHASLALVEEEKALKQDIADSKKQYGVVQQDVVQEFQEFQGHVVDQVIKGPVSDLQPYVQYISGTDQKLFFGPYEKIRTDLEALQRGGNQPVNPQQQAINQNLINRGLVPATGVNPSIIGGTSAINGAQPVNLNAVNGVRNQPIIVNNAAVPVNLVNQNSLVYNPIVPTATAAIAPVTPQLTPVFSTSAVAAPNLMASPVVVNNAAAVVNPNILRITNTVASPTIASPRTLIIH